MQRGQMTSSLLLFTGMRSFRPQVGQKMICFSSVAVGVGVGVGTGGFGAGVGVGTGVGVGGVGGV